MHDLLAVPTYDVALQGTQLLTRLFSTTEGSTSVLVGRLATLPRKRVSTVLLAVSGGMVHVYCFSSPTGKSDVDQASCQDASWSSE